MNPYYLHPAFYHLETEGPERPSACPGSHSTFSEDPGETRSSTLHPGVGALDPSLGLELTPAGAVWTSATLCLTREPQGGLYLFRS